MFLLIFAYINTMDWSGYLLSHHDQCVLLTSTKTAQPNQFPVHYWSLYDNKLIRKFRGHTGEVTDISLCPADDSFLTASKDKTVRYVCCLNHSTYSFVDDLLWARPPSAFNFHFFSPSVQIHSFIGFGTLQQLDVLPRWTCQRTVKGVRMPALIPQVWSLECRPKCPMGLGM